MTPARESSSAPPLQLKFPSKEKADNWNLYVYNRSKYWGGFPVDAGDPTGMFRKAPWALGPFTKHPANPILAPTPGAWDTGRYDGGVHNGAIIVREGKFFYVYRGERPIDIPQKNPEFGYMCDIGIATSADGIAFVKDTLHSPFFRKGPRTAYSYEDVNLVERDGTYYLFCNQWDWEHHNDPRVSGTFLATSRDLLHWETHGIVFPNATRTHRNGVVLHDPHNRAVDVNGTFLMYLNDGLIAFSHDLIHWKSRDTRHRWPGGEGCLALTGHSPEHPGQIILFTGGNHTGHFYAIGEVLFNKNDPEKPLDWLPAPVLSADAVYPWEDGRDAANPERPISNFRDCIFFNGLTFHEGTWWLYYGGSEYYTCLATASQRAPV